MFDTTDFLSDSILSNIQFGIGDTNPMPILFATAVLDKWGYGCGMDDRHKSLFLQAGQGKGIESIIILI